MSWKTWWHNRAVQKRLRALSEAERQAILAVSPYEAAAFQGEGYHVFRKDDPDFHRGYVISLGEISPREAEDWIIQQFWQQFGQESEKSG